MGWVVYDDQYKMVTYYKRPAPAKAAVTRYQNQLEKGYRSWPRIKGCCTYRDYEGILMGLRGEALKMWQFCNTKTG